MPSTIEQLHRELKPRGLTVLAVNIQESRDKVAAWVKARGLTMRVLLDEGEVATRYHVTVTPTVVVIGRDGGMVARAHGTRPWSGAEGRELLLALLKR